MVRVERNDCETIICLFNVCTKRSKVARLVVRLDWFLFMSCLCFDRESNPFHWFVLRRCATG